MVNSIGDFAVNIALIQTIPGWESKVYNRFKKACIHANIHEFHFFKGFGTFDIILIYLTDNFGHHHIEEGPVPGVLKANLLFCYPYFGIDRRDYYNALVNSTFAGFCLLKISPGLINNFPDIDINIREYAINNIDIQSILGSVGSHEIVVILNGENPDVILHDLYDLGQCFFVGTTRKLGVAIKTLSFLALNHKYIPEKYDGRNTIKYFENHFNQNITLKNELVNGSDSVSITCDITVKPIYVKDVKTVFSELGFSCVDVAGKRDLVVKPKVPTSWARLLACIFYFRCRFSDKILSTNTKVYPFAVSVYDQNVEDSPVRVKITNFKYKTLIKTFGNSLGPALANHFHTLSALLNNPICGFDYADISKYPEYIIETSKQLIEPEPDGQIQRDLRFAESARQLLISGAELRSYGTYETIEEVTGRFSEFRGGCQLALIAIEYIPFNILSSFYAKNSYAQGWSGFILVKEPKFSHKNEVINIPPSALLNPQEWWALYHEIGHIIFDHDDNIGGYNSFILKGFLANKDYPEVFYQGVVELAAEVIGFELGFFGDFELFLKLLWDHLKTIDPYQKNSTPIGNYAIRSYFVQAFCGLFRSYEGIDKFDENKFNDLDYLFSEIIDHLKRIEKLANISFDKDVDNDIYSIAAKNVKTIRELLPFMKHLNSYLDEMELTANASKIHQNNTVDVFNQIESGKIWFKEVDYPEAVLYRMIKGGITQFSASVAFIITMANQHKNHFSDRFHIEA